MTPQRRPSEAKDICAPLGCRQKNFRSLPWKFFPGGPPHRIPTRFGSFSPLVGGGAASATKSYQTSWIETLTTACVRRCTASSMPSTNLLLYKPLSCVVRAVAPLEVCVYCLLQTLFPFVCILETSNGSQCRVVLCTCAHRPHTKQTLLQPCTPGSPKFKLWALLSMYMVASAMTAHNARTCTMPLRHTSAPPKMQEGGREGGEGGEGGREGGSLGRP